LKKNVKKRKKNMARIKNVKKRFLHLWREFDRGQALIFSSSRPFVSVDF